MGPLNVNPGDYKNEVDRKRKMERIKLPTNLHDIISSLNVLTEFGYVKSITKKKKKRLKFTFLLFRGTDRASALFIEALQIAAFIIRKRGWKIPFLECYPANRNIYGFNLDKRIIYVRLRDPTNMFSFLGNMKQ